jgi:dimethylargininase
MLALTSAPPTSLSDGQRTYVPWQQVAWETANRQHDAYCHLLRQLGAAVDRLEACAQFPDSMFVEDTAIVLDELAIITSMGTRSRQGETERIGPILKSHREVTSIPPPARIEGGDVLVTGRTILIGQSPRTDLAGILALQEIVQPLGYQVVPVPVHGALHLKTACCALPDGRLLLNPDWLDTRPLQPFAQLVVPPSEPWGANFVVIHDRIGLAAEHAETAELLDREGYSLATVPLSEFAKMEGGPTCLSLLIR